MRHLTKSIGGVCLVISLMVATLVIGAPTPAGAITGGGGCGFATVSGPIETSETGTTFRGEVDLQYRTNTGQVVTISCELFVAGDSRGIVLGPVTGTGLVVDAGLLEYVADEGDTVRIC